MLHNFISIILNDLKSIGLSTILKILKVCKNRIVPCDDVSLKEIKSLFKLHLKVWR